MVSPSVFWGDKFIVHYVEALSGKPVERIWLDIGTKEGQNSAEQQEAVTNTRLLESALVKKGWKLEKDLKYFEAQGAEHNERARPPGSRRCLSFCLARSKSRAAQPRA